MDTGLFAVQGRNTMTNTRYEVFDLVRDSAGLDHKEKHFINTVESRGEMYGNWKNNAMIMGFKRDMFFTTRTAVLDKGIVKAVRRMDDTTIYTVDVEALRKWKTAHPYPDMKAERSDYRNEDDPEPTRSDSQNEYSDNQNDHSGMTEPKVPHEGTPFKEPHNSEPVVDESFKVDQDVDAGSDEPAGSPSAHPVVDSDFLKEDQNSLTDEKVSDQTSLNVPKEPTGSAHSDNRNEWSNDPAKQIRDYAKSHSCKHRTQMLIAKFESGLYPELKGDVWTRHALVQAGVPEGLQDAQW
jgi:hypothetical protein